MYKIIGGDGREYGPISAQQLRQWIAEGRANAATRVLAEGATEWKPLGSLPEFALSAPPPPMGAPAVLTVAPLRKTNGFGVAGMILGIVSFCFCCCYGLPFNVLGLIFSIIALVQIRNNPQRYDGQGMAIAGLVLSIVSLCLFILMGLLGKLSDFNEFSQRL